MGATILLHNFTAIVTVYTHSHPIAKVLYIGSVIKNFSVYHLTINNLSSCFFFFLSSPKMGREKEKTTAELTQPLTTLASYIHPSQSIRQRCIAMRLARPTIAFLPLPVLCNSRLYI